MERFSCIRRVDCLGRIVLPKQVRKFYSLEEGSRLELTCDKESIVLKKSCLLKDNSLLISFINAFYEQFNKSVIAVFDNEIVAASSKFKSEVGERIDKLSQVEKTVFELDLTGDKMGQIVVFGKINKEEELACKLLVKMFRQQD